MRFEPDRADTGYRPGSPRQRAVSSLLSAGLILLALLLAIYGSGVVRTPEKSTNPVTFDVAGNEQDSGARAEKKPKTKEVKAKDTPREQATQPVVSEEPAEKKPAFTFLKMSHEDFMATDIGKMKGPGLARGNTADSGSGGTYGPGEGPGGVTLYRAEWRREPTDAQLGGYLPTNAPVNGWGEIACQTIENYRVENCQILAESPRGSGLARAVQNAAWQFEVVPPRVNGKPQIGAWVRIRIDYGVRRSG